MEMEMEEKNKTMNRLWRFLFCAVLPWHTPKVGIGSFNGCSFASICKRCGKRILQDSQGNWFTVD